MKVKQKATNSNMTIVATNNYPLLTLCLAYLSVFCEKSREKA